LIIIVVLSLSLTTSLLVVIELVTVIIIKVLVVATIVLVHLDKDLATVELFPVERFNGPVSVISGLEFDNSTCNANKSSDTVNESN
jgi:hypothetical protein